jgi:hypothetical protein
VSFEVDAQLPPIIFGIRMVGTSWAFLRADCSVDYLARLAEYTLRPTDRLDVWAWSGEPASVGAPQTADVKWGLDYQSLQERELLIRMVAAITLEAQDLAGRRGRGCRLLGLRRH